MSVRKGNKFIAGNLALKIADRLFTIQRTLEDAGLPTEQEYYDIIVPIGAKLGFMDATRVVVVASGTNTTTTPILRYGAEQFWIVQNKGGALQQGDIQDQAIFEMYVKDMATLKPGSTFGYIYRGQTTTDYDGLSGKPLLVGRDGIKVQLEEYDNNYTDLRLPYIIGNQVVVNDLDLLTINTSAISIGKADYSHTISFVSGNRLIWKQSATSSFQLATTRDLEELAIGDEFQDVLTYSRQAVTDMNAITDMNEGDTCLVVATKEVYEYNATTPAWVLAATLTYTDADKGKYFDIEDIDGTHSGKAIWKINPTPNTGEFKVFTDYTNSIDGVTIVKDPTTRAMKVAKLGYILTLKNVDKNGQVIGTPTEFDGSADEEFEVNIDLSDYYNKTEVDQLIEDAQPNYNAVAGNMPVFYQADPVYTNAVTVMDGGTGYTDGATLTINGVDFVITAPAGIITGATTANTSTVITGNYQDPTDGAELAVASTLKTPAMIKIEDSLIPKTTVAKLAAADTYLNTNGTPVDATKLSFNGTAAGIFDGVLNLDAAMRILEGKSFAYTDVINNFVAGQTIASDLIATRPWVDTTWFETKFNYSNFNGASILKGSNPSTSTSLRFTNYKHSDGTTANVDVELPLVDTNNNGLITPAQLAIINNVANKLDISSTNTTDVITSNYGYNGDSTFKINTKQGTEAVLIQSSWDGTDLTLEVGMDTSRIFFTKTGVYVNHNEGPILDTNHLIATQQFVNTSAVLKANVVVDSNGAWAGKQVLLNAAAFVNLMPGSATLRVFGSDINAASSASVEQTLDVSLPIVTSTTAGFATAGLFNQVTTNTADIATLKGTSRVGAHLGTSYPITQAQVQAAWDAAKPGITVVEGSTVVNMDDWHAWTYMNVSGTDQWVDRGVDTINQADNNTIGIVKGSATGAGTIFVENDGTMAVNGWDDLNTTVSNIDTTLEDLGDDFDAHVADVVSGNTEPHVSGTDRTAWDDAATKATNAIPQVAAAVGNNIAIWTADGKLQDSLMSIVTNFTTPSNTTIPTGSVIKEQLDLKLNIAQGTTNANKSLTTDANGNVILIDPKTLDIGSYWGTYRGQSVSNVAGSLMRVDITLTPADTTSSGKSTYMKVKLEDSFFALQHLFDAEVDFAISRNTNAPGLKFCNAKINNRNLISVTRYLLDGDVFKIWLNQSGGNGFVGVTAKVYERVFSSPSFVSVESVEATTSDSDYASATVFSNVNNNLVTIPNLLESYISPYGQYVQPYQKKSATATWIELFTLPRGTINSTYGSLTSFEFVAGTQGDAKESWGKYRCVITNTGVGYTNQQILNMIELTQLEGTFNHSNVMKAYIDSAGLIHIAVIQAANGAPFVKCSDPVVYGTDVNVSGGTIQSYVKNSRVVWTNVVADDTQTWTPIWQHYPKFANNPTLWSYGVEINLGDGTFGYRKNGAVSFSANQGAALAPFTVDGLTANRQVIAVGGKWVYPAGGSTFRKFGENTCGTNYDSQAHYSGAHLTGNSIDIFFSATAATSNSMYDVWVRYSK
jgi:hypothetical protein